MNWESYPYDSLCCVVPTFWNSIVLDINNVAIFCHDLQFHIVVLKSDINFKFTFEIRVFFFKFHSIN